MDVVDVKIISLFRVKSSRCVPRKRAQLKGKRGRYGLPGVLGWACWWVMCWAGGAVSVCVWSCVLGFKVIRTLVKQRFVRILLTLLRIQVLYI